jgi:AcrR family transcriptional regulator
MAEVAGRRLLPPRADWSDAKRRLFEAAIVMFGDRGVHGVSVRDLMGSLGQQPGALYGHVASKQELLAELVRVGYEEHRRWISDALLAAGADPADQVRAVMRAAVLVHMTYPDLARVVQREMHALEDEDRAKLSTVLAESERIWLDVVDRGIRLGAFKVSEPVLAVAAMTAMAGRSAEQRYEEFPFSHEEIAESYAELAVKILS